MDTLTGTCVLRREHLQNKSTTVFYWPEIYKYGMQKEILLQSSGEWMIDYYCEAATTIFWCCPSPYAKDKMWYEWQSWAISNSARHAAVSALSLGGDQTGSAKGTSRASGSVLYRHAINLREEEMTHPVDFHLFPNTIQKCYGAFVHIPAPLRFLQRHLVTCNTSVLLCLHSHLVFGKGWPCHPFSPVPSVVNTIRVCCVYLVPFGLY